MKIVNRNSFNYHQDEVANPAAVARYFGYIVTAVWMFVFALSQINIGGVWSDSAPMTWIILSSWVVIYLISYLAIVRASGAVAHKPADNFLEEVRWINASIKLLSIACILGSLMVVFDFAILRGYGFSTSAAQIRVEEVTAAMKGQDGISPISGIGRLAIPAVIPMSIIAILKWDKLSAPTKYICLAVIPILLFEQIFFEGGRTFLAALFGSCLVTWLVKKKVKGITSKLNARRISSAIFIIVIAIILLSLFSYIFVDRILDRDAFFWSSYVSYVGYFNLDVDTAVIARLDGVFGSFWFVVSMFWIYITQGISEFDQILQISHFSHAKGLYQLPQVAQIANLLFGTDFGYDQSIYLLKSGTYVTFIGSNYIDFGYWGAMVSAPLLASFSGYSMLQLSRGRLNGISLCGPIFILISLFAPIFSLITNLWPCILWSFGIIWIKHIGIRR